MSTPVAVGNDLYGLADRRKGQFVRLDANTGKVVWEGPGRQGENASLTHGNGRLIALTTEARLIFFQTGGSTFQLDKTYEVASSPTWAHHAFYGDQILIKSKDRLSMWSFR